MLSLALVIGVLACGQSPTDPDIEPSSVEIEASTVKILIGGDTRLSAVVRNRGGQTLPGATVRWSSTDESRVRARGLEETTHQAQVAGEGLGTGYVVAAAGKVSDSTTVVVVDSNSVEGIGIIEPPSLLAVGEMRQLQAAALDAQGGVIRGVNLHWSSSNPAVASVSSTGSLEPQSAGSVRITAAYAEFAEAFDLEVTSAQRAYSGLPAFPGAEGSGAEALRECRERPLVHHRVTNTNDSGEGSLRDILENRVSPYQYDIVTFATGGTIELASTLSIQTACLYIAGQTAPGGGIQLRNKPGRIHDTFNIPRNGNVHDIVVRYMKIRTGDVDSDRDIGDPVGIRSGVNIVFDHCSVQFGNDENFEIWTNPYNGQEVRDVSIQWNLISQALGPHSTGVAVGRGRADSPAPPISNVDFHHNLVAQTGHRMPRLRDDLSNVRWINNVVYDWGARAGRTSDSTGLMKADFIRNYYKAGPRNTDTKNYLQNEWRMEDQPAPSVYLEGNIADPLQMDPDADQGNLYRWKGPGGSGPVNGQPVSLRPAPLPASFIPIRIETAQQAFESTLSSAGASQRLNCLGQWLPNRDVLDAGVVEDTRNRTGPALRAYDMTSVSDWGGIPSLASGAPCADSDGDGLPDEYESHFGLDPRDPADADRDGDSDGYINLEEYLNGTAP